MSFIQSWLKPIYVVFAFCSAFIFGGLKSVIIGPIAALIVIFGNVGVILGLLPAHVCWTIYTLFKTNRLDISLKIVFLLALPGLFGLWLSLGIAGSILVGVGYGFFTPWISSFEAFRQECERTRIKHCIVDGTWHTIKGSCTVVRDFFDMCYHSYLLYLKELREISSSEETQTLRGIHVPGCIIVGIVGLIIEIPLYTIIAIIKSPYLLFVGWYRLLHDLVSREGPFLETACIPIAGLAILLWPLFVVGSVLLAIFSSVFIGLYAAVIVYKERSFRRGLAYAVAMVAEFDEYSNDLLYLREGSIFPKPRYTTRRASYSTEFSVGGRSRGKSSALSTEAPAMLVPNLAPSKSVREAIHEVEMVQIWENMMQTWIIRGKELVDANVITLADLKEWSGGKSGSEATIVGIGLPTNALLVHLLHSIRSGSSGLLLIDGVEVNHLNRPQDRLLDWFFQPLMVLKEQIKAINMVEGELRYLEKVTLFGSDTKRIEAWENGSVVPEDALRTAQIQGISRRLMGITRSVSKFPTYRRRFSQVVKILIAFYSGKESSTSGSVWKESSSGSVTYKSGAIMEGV